MFKLALIGILFLLSPALFGQQKEGISEIVISHSENFFMCGNSYCNGYKVSYFPNGQVQLEGNFRKGKAIGKIKSYHKSGKLMDERFFKNGILCKTLSYDTLGNLIRDLNWKKKSLTTFYYNSAGQNIKKEIFSWKDTGWDNRNKIILIKQNGSWIKD